MKDMWRGVVLLGPPGSGKGTQGRAIGALPGFLHYNCGESLRDTDPQTQPGQQVRSSMKVGELVPSELVIDLFKEAVQKRIEQDDFDPARDSILLDGLPRNIDQAQKLEAYVNIERVIHLFCDRKELLIQRIQQRGRQRARQRADDLDRAVIERRLHVYEKQTAGLLDYYPATSIVRVDAALSPLRVLHEFVQSLLTTDTRDGD